MSSPNNKFTVSISSSSSTMADTTTSISTSNENKKRKKNTTTTNSGTTSDPAITAATLNSFFASSSSKNNKDDDDAYSNNSEDEDNENQSSAAEESPSQISAEIIKRAVQNLDRKNNKNNKLGDYQVRLAIRELKELIRKTTERYSLPSSNVTSLSSSSLSITTNQMNNTDSSNEEFKTLRERLGRLLIQTEQNEKLSQELSVDIQQNFWSTCNYTPLDLLDVMILGGGGNGGTSTSDMTMDALKIVHSKWKSACSAAHSEALEKLSEMELVADWMEVLNKFDVPRNIQNQLFNQVKTLENEKARKIRLVISVARAHACLSARETFVSRFEETSVLIRGALQKQQQMIEKRKKEGGKNDDEATTNKPLFSFPVFAPPELFDLAEDLFPRIKAFEVAVGFPFFLSTKLMEECGLKLLDENELGITGALNRIMTEENSDVY